MTTRQEAQIAEDFVRNVNIMNDLLDSISYILKEVNPETGENFQLIQEDGTYQDATFEELKERGVRAGQNILGYRNKLNNFIAKYGETNTQNALVSRGYDFTELRSDITDMEIVAQSLIGNAKVAENKDDLKAIAGEIDKSIPKLVLIRRPWCLGE